MSRFDTRSDPISRLEYEADGWSKREQPRQPNPRPTAAECVECPPHRWDVTTTELTVEERCVKCPAERSRPRFDKALTQAIAKNLDDSTRGLIREAHARLRAMRALEPPMAQRALPVMPRTTKLTIEQVRDIRDATGSHASIARHYGVNPSTVRDIRNRVIWAEVR